MRVAGFDPGLRRIGVALSVDGAGFPLAVISRVAGWQDHIRNIVAEYNVEMAVVGVPLSLAGAETESTRMARRFIEELQPLFGTPIVEVDERFSSRGVERALGEAGVSTRDQRGRVDDLAAADILQRYLDGLRDA
ncbi:Holliday junction resolvase RuvX [Ferrimicrobium sp.]|uniref:Holliday junction resolvase RuvX n=1 Tax=Ferrimicrobium sp. TaxID=2926050 RepID=UPI002604ACDB|nr:Holliday junction resolvase RuvX [Ferrimicrobium sp.]